MKHKGRLVEEFLDNTWIRENQNPQKITRVATSLAFYRSQKGLSLENSEKSPKRGSRGLSAPGSKKLKKSRKKVEKGPKTRKKLEKWSFSTLFRFFFDPRAERPRNPFSDFFRSFLGRGLFDSCRRPTMSQHKRRGFLSLALKTTAEAHHGTPRQSRVWTLPPMIRHPLWHRHMISFGGSGP